MSRLVIEAIQAAVLADEVYRERFSSPADREYRRQRAMRALRRAGVPDFHTEARGDRGTLLVWRGEGRAR